MSDMAQREPIIRRTLHDELVGRVRSLIVEGEIPAGERINEKALCERFGVSRTPLREALKVLALESYVVLTPNRGASVAELTESDLQEAFPIMGALEALAGEHACHHATDAEIAEIRALHDEMEEHFLAGDRKQYFQLNERIHHGIAEAAHNPTLTRMQRSLDGRVRRGRYQANISETRWIEAMQEHRRIIVALEARDGPRLAAELRAHLENKMTALKDTLAARHGGSHA